MFPCSSNPNSFQNFLQNNSNPLSSNLQEEEDLDIDSLENIHYISNSDPKQLDIKIINIKENPERVAILADQNRIVIVNSNANDKEFEFDINPLLTEKYKNIQQINYEDEFGNRRTLRNDGTEPGFVIRAQSQAQMRAIARTVNRVSLRILQEKKKSSEIPKEDQEHREVSIEPEYKINLKHVKVQEISPDEDKTTDITCKTFKATLKSQEVTGQAVRHKKQKEAKELEHEAKLHQKIIAKEVTQFELNREIVSDDYLKTTQRVEKLHEQETLIPEILTVNH